MKSGEMWWKLAKSGEKWGKSGGKVGKSEKK